MLGARKMSWIKEGRRGKLYGVRAHGIDSYNFIVADGETARTFARGTGQRTEAFLDCANFSPIVSIANVLFLAQLYFGRTDSAICYNKTSENEKRSQETGFDSFASLQPDRQRSLAQLFTARQRTRRCEEVA